MNICIRINSFSSPNWIYHILKVDIINEVKVTKSKVTLQKFRHLMSPGNPVNSDMYRNLCKFYSPENLWIPMYI